MIPPKKQDMSTSQVDRSVSDDASRENQQARTAGKRSKMRPACVAWLPSIKHNGHPRLAERANNDLPFCTHLFIIRDAKFIKA
jgi:hypothetical protein